MNAVLVTLASTVSGTAAIAKNGHQIQLIYLYLIIVPITPLRQAMTPSNEISPVADVLAAANQIILGKDAQIRLALSCLLARGHLLIEDLPGVGKTTLAQALARLLGLHFSRIQFTSDMLPADIIGVSVFDRDKAEFRFLPGPIFAQVVLADEINRATPKTQSALLEAMEERQVTTEGKRGHYRSPSSSSQPRILHTRSEPSRSPNRSLTVFCCASNWAIRAGKPSGRCSKAVAGVTSCHPSPHAFRPSNSHRYNSKPRQFTSRLPCWIMCCY